jgi:hypothetical protein
MVAVGQLVERGLLSYVAALSNPTTGLGLSLQGIAPQEGPHDLAS